MIAFEEFGKTIKLRNDDWKNLKKRFDPKNAKWSWGKRYRILMDCSLCERYQCETCPFSEIAMSYGCMSVLGQFFKQVRFSVSKDSVYWTKWANKQARRQLRQIQKIMNKIEASQEQ